MSDLVSRERDREREREKERERKRERERGVHLKCNLYTHIVHVLLHSHDFKILGTSLLSSLMSEASELLSYVVNISFPCSNSL